MIIILLAIADYLNNKPETDKKISRPHDLNIPVKKWGYPAPIDTFNKRSSESFFSPSVFFQFNYIPRRVRAVRCLSLISDSDSTCG